MSAELPPGTILLDKYRVDRVLGKGGMGVVLAATHLQLNERVAMKFLLPEVLSNREVVQRFMREAQAAVRLKGEHVARVIDVGTLPWGAPYLVMEFLQGMDLAAHIEQCGTLPSHEAVDYLLQACEALAEAHSLGIIHRDVKPANFFITKRPDGSALLKVLDFGISKAPVTVDGGLTNTQAVMGTPSYMSPEQMRSVRDVDARTDIWALGVVLYEAVSGRRPFEAETFSALCLKAAMDPTPPLSVRVPKGLDLIIYRCLEKAPTHRFSSVAELAAAIAPYAGNQRQASIVVERTAAILGLAAPARGVGAAQYGSPPRSGDLATGAPYAASAAHTTLGASAGSLSSNPRSSRRRAWIGGALVAVATAVTAIVLLTRGGDGASKASDHSEVEPVGGVSPPAPESAPPSSVQPDEVAPAVEPEVRPVDPSSEKRAEDLAAEPGNTDIADNEQVEPAPPVKPVKPKPERHKGGPGDRKPSKSTAGDQKPVEKPAEIKKPVDDKKVPYDPLNSRT